MIATSSSHESSSSQLKIPYNHGYIWLICTVAALGGLLFGWDWVVIGGAKPFFERYFELKNPGARWLGEQLRPGWVPRGLAGRRRLE